MTGIEIHISTFCRAVRRLGFTRQRLQQYALKRDADAAAQFWATVKHHGFTADMILAVDETSKDKRVLRRSFGYALRGKPPIGASGLKQRGERISTLCSFDVDGFVAWQYTGGTYNRETWSEAAEDVILPHVAPQGPGGPRSVVLLDNASIHKSRRFLHACNMRGAIVLFTTPCAPACPRPPAPHHAPRLDRTPQLIASSRAGTVGTKPRSTTAASAPSCCGCRRAPPTSRSSASRCGRRSTWPSGRTAPSAARRRATSSRSAAGLD